MKYKEIDYYLGLPWNYDVSHSDDEREPYTARVRELQGCMAHGETASKALLNLPDAIKSFVFATQLIEQKMPEPGDVTPREEKLSFNETKAEQASKEIAALKCIIKTIDPCVAQIRSEGISRSRAHGAAMEKIQEAIMWLNVAISKCAMRTDYPL